jgi:hypothetical protein
MTLHNWQHPDIEDCPTDAPRRVHRISGRCWQTVGRMLAERARWSTHGSLRGEPVTDGSIDHGRLPADWSRTLTARRHLVDYVIRSYATPIAWHDLEAGWIIPAEHYSVTTSKHQSLIRSAVSGHLGESYEE